MIFSGAYIATWDLASNARMTKKITIGLAKWIPFWNQLAATTYALKKIYELEIIGTRVYIWFPSNPVMINKALTNKLSTDR